MREDVLPNSLINKETLNQPSKNLTGCDPVTFQIKRRGNCRSIGSLGSFSPHFHTPVLEEVIKVVEKGLLTSDTDGVAPPVVGIDEDEDGLQHRDQVVDHHQQDGQPDLAKPLGRCAFIEGEF